MWIYKRWNDRPWAFMYSMTCGYVYCAIDSPRSMSDRIKLELTGSCRSMYTNASGFAGSGDGWSLGSSLPGRPIATMPSHHRNALPFVNPHRNAWSAPHTYNTRRRSATSAEISLLTSCFKYRRCHAVTSGKSTKLAWLISQREGCIQSESRNARLMSSAR